MPGVGCSPGARCRRRGLRILPDRWGVPIGPFGEPEFERLCLGPGQAGEIVVSGPHVLKGYLRGEGDRETKFKVDGETWHRTGDAGCVDQEGSLWLLGRCAARIERPAGCPLSVHGRDRRQQLRDRTTRGLRPIRRQTNARGGAGVGFNPCGFGPAEIKTGMGAYRPVAGPAAHPRRPAPQCQGGLSGA